MNSVTGSLDTIGTVLNNLECGCETTFSAVKRVFGETLMSRRTDMMMREAILKFVQYDSMLGASSCG